MSTNEVTQLYGKHMISTIINNKNVRRNSFAFCEWEKSVWVENELVFHEKCWFFNSVKKLLWDIVLAIQNARVHSLTLKTQFLASKKRLGEH